MILLTATRLPVVLQVVIHGGAENDGHDNDGPSELQGMKLQDMKLTILQGMKNAGHDNYLFIVVSTNPDNFSRIVKHLM